MAKLTKLERSNRAHKILRDRHSSLHRKHQYHQYCISNQNRSKRVLTRSERKKIWDSTSVTPY